MSNEFFTPPTNQGRDSLHTRSDRVSARTISATRGQAIPIDSIISPDGIPSGILWRAKVKGKWKAAQKARRLRMKLIKYHPICVLWFTSLLTIGAILQVVVK